MLSWLRLSICSLIFSERLLGLSHAAHSTALRTGFFVGADCGSAPACGRGQVFGLDSRKDLRHPCKVFHALERLLAVQQHVPSHRWSIALLVCV